MSVQQGNTTAAMWPCATTPLAHITAHVIKDMLEAEESVQVRRRSGCLLFFTFTINCIPSFNNDGQIYSILIGWPTDACPNSISNAKCPHKGSSICVFLR